MVGAIVKRDILAHPLVTVRCFGWWVFLRALCAGRNTTFLSLLTSSAALEPAGEGVPEFVARCVELELKAGRIYESLSRRFSDQPSARDFFASLTRQEAAHAELLEVAETAASRERWDEDKATPWHDVVTSLEPDMQRAASSLGEIHTLQQALRLVIDIESSEINQLFHGVVSASDSNFVKRIRTFHQAENRHLRFICRAIEQLDPELVPACQGLKQRLSAVTE